MRNVEYLADSLDYYSESSPPFVWENAREVPVQLGGNGGKQTLRPWELKSSTRNQSFATLGLNGKTFIVKALAEDWERGDSMESNDDWIHWFAWQGPLQKFVGREFDGPVATTCIGLGRSSQIDHQVNPYLHVPFNKTQSKWVNMLLSEAHPQPAGVEKVTMQSLFTKCEEILKRRFGSIHILDAAFEETVDLAANDSKRTKGETFDRTKICRPVYGTFERFYALVQEYRQLSRSDRGHIKLTAVA